MTRSRTGAIALLVAALSLTALGHGPAPAAASSGRAGRAPAADLARLRTAAFYSPALGGAAHVNILLPEGYASSRRHYPVLYLLAGHMGGYRQWMANGEVVPATRGLPLIVVMPDGLGGWYTNPANGAGPRWEDYMLDDLIPYVDGHYRTVADRAGRAVAGLSMGGTGAFDYAARHPDTFVAAGSFSGSLDITGMEGAGWHAAFPDLAVYGDPSTYGWFWDGHNPVELAPNLRGVRLYLASGNGLPGPYEPHGHYPDPDPGEQYAHANLVEMAAALARAGIPATIEDYGPGVHTWPYWQRDLRHALPLFMDAFAHPPTPALTPTPPVPWSYRTVDDRFAVWGWSYQVARPAGTHGWTEFQNVSRFGLTAAGAGVLTITTARLYPPGASYALALDGAPAGQARADAAGRLHLTLALSGPRAPHRLDITGEPSPAP